MALCFLEISDNENAAFCIKKAQKYSASGFAMNEFLQIIYALKTGKEEETIQGIYRLIGLEDFNPNYLTSIIQFAKGNEKITLLILKELCKTPKDDLTKMDISFVVLYRFEEEFF